MSRLTPEREAEIRARAQYLVRMNRLDLDVSLSWEEESRSDLLDEIDALRAELAEAVAASEYKGAALADTIRLLAEARAELKRYQYLSALKRYQDLVAKRKAEAAKEPR